MSSCEAEILHLLTTHLSAINSRAMLRYCTSRAAVSLERLGPGDSDRLMAIMASAIDTFARDGLDRARVLAELRQVLATSSPAPATMSVRVLPISSENDLVEARGWVRHVTEELGFTDAARMKIVTVVSELTRNILMYAGRGELEIRGLVNGRRGIEIIARDQGPGITFVDDIMSGRYRSKTGLGKGIAGTKKLMDEFELDTAPGRGTTVRVKKYL